ncbi:hypothetical protein [Acetobacter senegalensis]|uniref:hypothetical protein n=1 Tax=Acetobacter senegalensis TaxID=446692 RepID=UPI00142F2A8D|nr:hypothetical protein [Acetobacter senegalensis]
MDNTKGTIIRKYSAAGQTDPIFPRTLLSLTVRHAAWGLSLTQQKPSHHNCIGMVWRVSALVNPGSVFYPEQFCALQKQHTLHA